MYDLVLTNGQMGHEPYIGNLCIQDGRIARITREPVEGREVADVGGLVVSPGFIDIHSHSDACPFLGIEPESKLYQGVTTEIVGNCGGSLLPSTPENNREIVQYFISDSSMFSQMKLKQEDMRMYGLYGVEEYARGMETCGASTNYGVLIGHGTLRGSVMGFVDREPTPEEMEKLKAALEKELKAGAFGMSLGLIYPPSAFSKREELVELAKVLKRYDAILSIHMRSEGPRIFQAVEEVIDIGRRSGAHVQISHLKLMGKPQWGRAKELLDRIHAAQAEGVHVTCDQYPYTATSTSMTALLPHWAHDGGVEALKERMRHPTEQLKREIAREMENRGGPDRVLVAGTHGYGPQWEGRTLAELSQELGESPESLVIRILDQCRALVSCIYFSIHEDDMRYIMADRGIAVGSDGSGFSLDPAITNTNPHPRSFGTFPRFLRLVREWELMPLTDAVYKLTGLPAKLLGITQRGCIREGNVADLTVFDAKTIRDTSEFTHSVSKPEGVVHVLVGGSFALRDGELTGAHRGGVLRRGQA